MSIIPEQWTDREIRNIRRNIAYHQKRSLRTISRDEALTILDEQQRRRSKLYSDDSRYYVTGWHVVPGEKHPCASRSQPKLNQEATP